jgi:alpha-1,2-mannosyltransferase
VVISPFRRLPNGADLELTWTWWQNWLASMTAVIGLTLLIGSIVAARRSPSVAAETLSRSCR